MPFGRCATVSGNTRAAACRSRYLSLEASTKLPSWMDARGERDHLLVKKRVTRLHAVHHGHAVALLAQQQSRKVDFVAKIERAIERMPARHALNIEVKILIGYIGAQFFLQPGAVVAAARPRHEIVDEGLGVGSANQGVDVGEFSEGEIGCCPFARESAGRRARAELLPATSNTRASSLILNQK